LTAIGLSPECVSATLLRRRWLHRQPRGQAARRSRARCYGTCIRDNVHFEFLAHAHLEALAYLQRGGDSAMLNFGYGRGHSVREAIAAVKQASGVDFAVRRGARRVGDPARLVASNDRLKAAFGWQPRGTSLDEIARSALAWEKRLLGAKR